MKGRRRGGGEYDERRFKKKRAREIKGRGTGIKGKISKDKKKRQHWGKTGK